MSQYLAVHHPTDASVPGFDFYGWRLQRRFVAAGFRALARTEPDPAGTMLREAAAGLEREQLTPDAVLEVQAYLASLGYSPVETTSELYRAVLELTTARQLDVASDVRTPVVRPEWKGTPHQRPLFVGLVNGTPFRARLQPTADTAPAYQVILADADGGAERPTDLGGAVGSYLHYAVAVWDWLVARRLTILCLLGYARWPDPERSPLLLDAGWSGSRRSL